MKLIDILFIFFSKIYIHFYEEKKDIWLLIPSHILSFIITLNLFTLSMLFFNLEIYYVLVFYLILYFILAYILDRRFDFITVKEYKLSKSTPYIIVILLIMNGVALFSLVNYMISIRR